MNLTQLGLLKKAMSGKNFSIPLGDVTDTAALRFLLKSADWSDWGRWGTEMTGSLLGGIGGFVGGSMIGTPLAGGVGGVAGTIAGGELGKGVGNWIFGKPKQDNQAATQPGKPATTVTSGTQPYPNYMAPPGQGGTSNRYMPSTTLPPGGLPQYGGYPGGIFGSSTPPSPGGGTSLLPGTMKSSSAIERWSFLKRAMSRWRRPENINKVNAEVKRRALTQDLVAEANKVKSLLPTSSHARAPVGLVSDGGDVAHHANFDLSGPVFSYRNKAAIKAWQDSMRESRQAVADPKRYGNFVSRPTYKARGEKQKKRSTAFMLSGGLYGSGQHLRQSNGKPTPVSWHVDPLGIKTVKQNPDSYERNYIDTLRTAARRPDQLSFMDIYRPVALQHTSYLSGFDVQQALRERFRAMLQRQQRLGVQYNRQLAPGFEALHRSMGHLPQTRASF